MTLREVLLTDFQADPLWMKFLAVSYMTPQIFLAGLVGLVDEMVVRLDELVVLQLLFLFLVDIADFPYDSIIM